MLFAVVFACFAVGLFWGGNASAIVVEMTPIMDNTIYDGFLDTENDPEFKDNTCGGGEEAFIGTQRRGGFARRALLQFDFSSIPTGSVINSVSLTIDISRSGDPQELAPATLHLVSQAWGEGTVDCGAAQGGGGQGGQADPGDATWISAMHDQNPAWNNLGGDFTPALPSFSATTTLPDSGTGTWNSADAGNSAMLADVQGWFLGTIPNNGWIVIGDETRSPTTRRFDTREGRNSPVLTVDFTVDGDPFACCLAAPDEGACQIVVETPTSPPAAQQCSDLGGTLPVGGETTCDPNPCPQPTGACCNADESCSVDEKDACEAAGGSFQGADSMCSDNNVDCGLEPFVDPLPIPGVVQPVGTRADGVLQYEVTMTQFRQQLHRDLPDTDVWGYNGAYPGPTLEAISDVPIEVKYTNNLPDEHYLAVDQCPHGPNYWQRISRTSVHLHGANIMARFDGHPDLDIFPGTSDVFQYPNTQIPATLWYHDHGLGITRLNVYMGLAAYYLIRDDFENNLGLPGGEFEVPVVVQDRMFNDDGTLFYPPIIDSGGFFGDKILVNGKVWPFLNVKQGKYRFRFLNGSQARTYTLRLEDLANPTQTIPFTLIGTDGGLVTAPIALDSFIMAPAERIDVVIDFAGFPAGTEIVLRNDNPVNPLPNVMKFIVTAEAGHTAALPAELRPVPTIPENEAILSRRFILDQEPELCSGTEWLVKSVDAAGDVIGQHWEDLTEFPQLGTTEIWEFENPSTLMHPMHVHLVQFQILGRTDLATGQSIPLEPWEINTWKDTARVLPGTSTRVIARFENWPGRFPYHCHILDHEDHEMMRQFQATNDPANCNSNDVCETGEDCVSCADCGFPADPSAPLVSGALCGNGLCEIGDGEDCITCPEDCNGKQKGGNRFCCGAGGEGPIPDCGIDPDGTVRDDRCTTSGFYCRVAERLRACCGDTLCEGQEQVDGPDFCELDCAAPAECIPTENNETLCFDGLDNDCNDATDCVDTNCDGEIGPATTCGIGECAATGNLTCSGGAEVDTCTPGTPGTEGPFGDATCNDNLDNDCDGLTDEAEDPDCQEAQCSDHQNRDDCRNDPNCMWEGGKNNGMCVPVNGCDPTEIPEVSCFDNLDNDCDLETDCVDTDCDGADGGPTTCGLGICASTGNLTCTGGAEVDTCTPGDPAPGGEVCDDPGMLDEDCDGLANADDPDCQGAACSEITKKNQCDNTPGCMWDRATKTCVDAP
jgi:spore coat protein A